MSGRGGAGVEHDAPAHLVVEQPVVATFHALALLHRGVQTGRASRSRSAMALWAR